MQVSSLLKNGAKVGELSLRQLLIWRQYLALDRAVCGKLGKGTKKFATVECTAQRAWGNLYPVAKTLRVVNRDHVTVA